MSEDADVISPRENHLFTGHQGVESALLDACKSSRLHHSLILAGPKGIGKATLAYRLARYLLKPEEGGLLGLEPDTSTGFDMSPDDHVFRQVASGGHPALRVIERGRNPDTGKLRRDIAVSDIRALSDFYRMTSANGSWRIAIIDPAEDMNQNAANALLKILEEPPERSVIILISHAPGRLLATIRSRCQFIQMSALSADDLTAVLTAQGAQTGHDDIDLLMKLSEGSVGAAANITRHDGLGIYANIRDLMDRSGNVFDRELDAFGDRLSKNGQDDAYELFTKLMERAISERIIERARASSSATAGGELDRWLDVWEKVRALFAQASGLGLDRKHVILNAFLHVSSVAGTASAR